MNFNVYFSHIFCTVPRYGKILDDAADPGERVIMRKCVQGGHHSREWVVRWVKSIK